MLLIVSAAISRSIFPRLGYVIDRMKDVAHGQGNFHTFINVPGSRGGSWVEHHDEIDTVMAAFNEMVMQIQERDHQLRLHNDHLEEEVAVRTDALTTANSDLLRAHAEIEMFLKSIPSIVIGLDLSGRVTRWNQAAEQAFGITAREAAGQTLDACGIRWLHPSISQELAKWLKVASLRRCDELAYAMGSQVCFLSCSVRPILSNQDEKMGVIVTGTDVTERKCLEEQLRQAHKLEAIGQLAAGIAHEINTPAQFIQDNTLFLKESWRQIEEVLAFCRVLQSEARQNGSVSIDSLAQFDHLSEEADFGYLKEEIPNAIDQSLQGLQRIAKIVRAIKEFSCPSTDERRPVDINRAIQATTTVAQGEWSGVAEMVLQLDPALPPVPCSAAEFNQVILNLIMNAAQAITRVVGDGSNGKGIITIATTLEGSFVQMVIRDTGTGIRDEIRSRIFEPFFSTQPVGQGTGQGLALAHSIIVKKHRGQIWFESEPGHGTTFFVRLPLAASTQHAGAPQ